MLNEEKSFIAMCKFLLWLFTALVISFIGLTGVCADTTDIGYISNDTQVLVSLPNQGAPITLNQSTYLNNANVNAIWFNISHTFTKNVLYQLEIYTPNAKLTNINTLGIEYNGGVCNFYGYSDANIGYPKIYFKCPQNTNYLSISLRNWDNNIITTGSNFQWNYTYLRSFDDDDELDLGPVISNQNQNTQDIINNQNQNTQDIINSNKVCNKIDKINIVESNKYLASDGTIGTNSDFGITDYISISDNSTLEQLTLQNSSSNAFMCFYNVNKSLLSCLSSKTHGIGSIILPNNTSFVRFSIIISENKPTFKICQNGNQAITDNINGLNDNINDDNTDGATSEASDFFSEFNTNTFGLTSIITAPLNLIQSLTSKSCTPLHLPLPYLSNKYLDLPCMSTIYSQHFGAFFTLYQTITYGIIAYWVCVRIFNHVKDFKNPEHDEIEVVDL